MRLVFIQPLSNSLFRKTRGASCPAGCRSGGEAPSAEDRRAQGARDVEPATAAPALAKGRPKREGPTGLAAQERRQIIRAQVAKILPQQECALYEIAKVLKFKVEQLDILEGNYSPQGWNDDDWEQKLVRKALIDVLGGRRPILFQPFNPSNNNGPYPPAPEIPKPTDWAWA